MVVDIYTSQTVTFHEFNDCQVIARLGWASQTMPPGTYQASYEDQQGNVIKDDKQPGFRLLGWFHTPARVMWEGKILHRRAPTEKC